MKTYSLKDLNDSLNNHKSPKIESHITNTNPNIRRNFQNLSNYNSENYLFTEKFHVNNISEKNNSKQSILSSSSKISNIPKSNYSSNINNHHLNTFQKNKYYLDYISKKSNINISNDNNKNMNEKGNNIIKPAKKILNLNKRIKREKYSNKININIPKLINTKKEDNNKHFSINSYSNKNENINNNTQESKENKNLVYNYSQGNLHKNLTYKENSRFDNLKNNEISPPMKIVNKKNKSGYILHQYYTDIEPHSYYKNNLKGSKNIYGNEFLEDSKIMKKDIYLNNPGKNEYIINTYIYNSPIEQHNIINNKNYISPNRNNSLSNQNKNTNSYSNKNAPLSPAKKEELKNKTKKKPKNNIPFDKIKVIQLNKSQYKKISYKNDINNESMKRSEINNNIRIKKNIFYYLYPNIYRDELSFQNIKNNPRTTKATLEDNDLNNKTIKIPINSDKLKIPQKKLIVENKNKNEIIHNLEDFNPEKKNKNISLLYNSQDNTSNNYSEQVKEEYLDDDIKSICIIDPRGNMNNNFIKISGANSSQKNIQYKNNKKNLKMIISKTSSNRKNISSTSRGALNLNNIEILNLKNTSTKQNAIYLNNTDNLEEHNIDNKNNKLILDEINNQKEKKNKSYKEIKNNKSIINIHSNAPNTLFKSIKTGKNLSPMKLYKNKKEKVINYELLHNMQSLKNSNLNNQRNKETNKSNTLKNDKDKINKTNNNINLKEPNNKKNINNSGEDNKNKDKNEIIKKKKKLINNFSENNIYEKAKNKQQYSSKKPIKKEIDITNINIIEEKLNKTKNMTKNQSEINTLEQNKNHIIIDYNGSSNKKVISPNYKIKSKKIFNKIYIKPNCPSPRNTKQNYTDRKLIKQISTSSRNQNNISFKNNHFMKTSFNQLSSFDKILYPNTSPKVKSHKSSNSLKINIKKDNSLPYNILELKIIDETKIREKIFKKYCFIKKYNDYFIKRPLIYQCYIGKTFKKNVSQIINSDYFSKSRDELDNNENDCNRTLSIKNITFAENKKSIEKVSLLINKENKIENNKQKEINEDKLELEEKLEILNDNFLDNEDIKLNYSDDNIEGNSIKLYATTLGKEIEDSEKKACKTYNILKKENKNNLENVEKGLYLLKNIAERIEFNSNEDSNDIFSNNIPYKKINLNKNNKIFIGTNKLNELIKNRSESRINFTEGNNIIDKDQKKINKNRISESLDKNLLVKGLEKIENIFEKKFNSKINTYQKTSKKMNIDSKEANIEKKLNTYAHIPFDSESKFDSKDLINNINIIKIEEKNSNNYLILNKNFFVQNSIKSDLIYLLNIITETNYWDIVDKLTEKVLYKINNEDEDNNNDEIITNEKYFKDIIFDKIFSEQKFVKLYSRLIKNLSENISVKLKEKMNIKINKEGTLKFIINEECINILNKYKNIHNEIILNDYNSENYILCKKNFRGYVSFIYELINLGFLKQQFGINIIEQFYKKYKEDDINIIYKNLYLDVCIILFDKLVEDIFKSKNQKLILCLNNFIDELAKDNNQELQNYLRFKIINSIEKMNNLSNKGKEKSANALDLFDKVLEEEVNNKLKTNKIIINKSNNKEKKGDEFELIIQEDLINYISYFSDKGNNGETIIKKEVDKSYNWKAIDDIINEKKRGLGYIINKFIQACSNAITKESQVLISNDYIKNIIEYYINNLSKEEIETVQNEMIKTYQNINDIINNNQFMCKILGNLLFILIENKLYHIKFFNNYLKEEKKTQINLAIITKYCIISAGKFAKKYFNDFKQTKLFINNNIFNDYVYKALNDLFYFFK